MTDIYYIEYKEPCKWYMKIISKLFFLYKEFEIDDSKHAIQISKKAICKRDYEKIKRLVKDGKILYSNRISADLYNNNFSGKVLMKYMLLDIIEKIEKITYGNFKNEDIYVTIAQDIDMDIIYDISKMFRCINIVTDKIKKMKLLEGRLDHFNVMYTISSNRKKSLKRAKIIINFDCESEFFENFNVNRNAIIINIGVDKIFIKTSFQGSIIENIEIDYKNEYEFFFNCSEFDKNKLYESYIIYNTYMEAREKIKNNECKVKSLVGIRSVIRMEELKNNFKKSSIKLDKYGKKD